MDICIPWKSSRPNKVAGFRMIHGARIPDPTMGQSLIFGLPRVHYMTISRAVPPPRIPVNTRIVIFLGSGIPN